VFQNVVEAGTYFKPSAHQGDPSATAELGNQWTLALMIKSTAASSSPFHRPPSIFIIKLGTI
jgi:hypothetical protein